jgi:aspartyl-tRNA(Asn)/glutamyl-tRNA(Gln) amidotransferase subunit A
MDSFRAALARLSAAGATVVELPMAEFAQAVAVNPRGALTSAEAYSWHIELMKLREQFIRTINAAASGYDAMLMPTTPETATHSSTSISRPAFRRELYSRWSRPSA